MTRTILAAAGLTLVAGAVVGLGTSGASGSAAPRVPRSLAQAMGEQHGQAAGDPTWRDPQRAGAGPDAEGVDAGTRRQATGVVLGRAAPVAPERLLSPGDRSGACTLGYGRGRACLPTTPPSAGQMGMTVQEMPWTCAEVRSVLPRGIALNVAGVDPAHLDDNGDGTACGAGDS